MFFAIFASFAAKPIIQLPNLGLCQKSADARPRNDTKKSSLWQQLIDATDFVSFRGRASAQAPRVNTNERLICYNIRMSNEMFDRNLLPYLAYDLEAWKKGVEEKL